MTSRIFDQRLDHQTHTKEEGSTEFAAALRARTPVTFRARTQEEDAREVLPHQTVQFRPSDPENPQNLEDLTWHFQRPRVPPSELPGWLPLELGGERPIAPVHRPPNRQQSDAASDVSAGDVSLENGQSLAPSLDPIRATFTYEGVSTTVTNPIVVTAVRDWLEGDPNLNNNPNHYALGTWVKNNLVPDSDRTPVQWTSAFEQNSNGSYSVVVRPLDANGTGKVHRLLLELEYPDPRTELERGGSLTPGEELISEDGMAKLELTADGQLQVTSVTDRQIRSLAWDHIPPQRDHPHSDRHFYTFEPDYSRTEITPSGDGTYQVVIHYSEQLHVRGRPQYSQPTGETHSTTLTVEPTTTDLIDPASLEGRTVEKLTYDFSHTVGSTHNYEVELELNDGSRVVVAQPGGLHNIGTTHWDLTLNPADGGGIPALGVSKDVGDEVHTEQVKLDLPVNAAGQWIVPDRPEADGVIDGDVQTPEGIALDAAAERSFQLTDAFLAATGGEVTPVSQEGAIAFALGAMGLPHLAVGPATGQPTPEWNAFVAANYPDGVTLTEGDLDLSMFTAPEEKAALEQAIFDGVGLHRVMEVYGEKVASGDVAEFSRDSFEVVYNDVGVDQEHRRLIGATLAGATYALTYEGTIYGSTATAGSAVGVTEVLGAATALAASPVGLAVLGVAAVGLGVWGIYRGVKALHSHSGDSQTVVQKAVANVPPQPEPGDINLANTTGSDALASVDMAATVTGILTDPQQGAAVAKEYLQFMFDKGTSLPVIEDALLKLEPQLRTQLVGEILKGVSASDTDYSTVNEGWHDYSALEDLAYKFDPTRTGLLYGTFVHVPTTGMPNVPAFLVDVVKHYTPEAAGSFFSQWAFGLQAGDPALVGWREEPAQMLTTLEALNTEWDGTDKFELMVASMAHEAPRAVEDLMAQLIPLSSGSDVVVDTFDALPDTVQIHNITSIGGDIPPEDFLNVLGDPATPLGGFFGNLTNDTQRTVRGGLQALTLDESAYLVTPTPGQTAAEAAAALRGINAPNVGGWVATQRQMQAQLLLQKPAAEAAAILAEFNPDEIAKLYHEMAELVDTSTPAGQKYIEELGQKTGLAAAKSGDAPVLTAEQSAAAIDGVMKGFSDTNNLYGAVSFLSGLHYPKIQHAIANLDDRVFAAAVSRSGIATNNNVNGGPPLLSENDFAVLERVDATIQAGTATLPEAQIALFDEMVGFSDPRHAGRRTLSSQETEEEAEAISLYESMRSSLIELASDPTSIVESISAEINTVAESLIDTLFDLKDQLNSVAQEVLQLPAGAALPPGSNARLVLTRDIGLEHGQVDEFVRMLQEMIPSTAPSGSPSTDPSELPSGWPSGSPSTDPSELPSGWPSLAQTASSLDPTTAQSDPVFKVPPGDWFDWIAGGLINMQLRFKATSSVIKPLTDAISGITGLPEVPGFDFQVIPFMTISSAGTEGQGVFARDDTLNWQLRFRFSMNSELKDALTTLALPGLGEINAVNPVEIENAFDVRLKLATNRNIGTRIEAVQTVYYNEPSLSFDGTGTDLALKGLWVGKAMLGQTLLSGKNALFPLLPNAAVDAPDGDNPDVEDPVPDPDAGDDPDSDVETQSGDGLVTEGDGLVTEGENNSLSLGDRFQGARKFLIANDWLYKVTWLNHDLVEQDENGNKKPFRPGFHGDAIPDLLTATTYPFVQVSADGTFTSADDPTDKLGQARLILQAGAEFGFDFGLTQVGRAKNKLDIPVGTTEG